MSFTIGSGKSGCIGFMWPMGHWFCWVYCVYIAKICAGWHAAFPGIHFPWLNGPNFRRDKYNLVKMDAMDLYFKVWNVYIGIYKTLAYDYTLTLSWYNIYGKKRKHAGTACRPRVVIKQIRIVYKEHIVIAIKDNIDTDRYRDRCDHGSDWYKWTHQMLQNIVV